MQRRTRTGRLAEKLEALVKIGQPYVFAAAPQVLGLIVQVLIIKVFFASSAAQTLSAYQFALTVSSIFYLGLAYQRAFIRISGFAVLIAQSLLFLAAALASYWFADTYVVTLCLYLSYFLTISLMQYAVLGSLNRNTYIAATTAISVLSPQLLWIGNLATLGLALVLLFLLAKCQGRRKTSGEPNSELNSEPLGGISYSILLQSPLLMLSLFDPLLAAIVGSNFYVNFVLFQKFTNGIALLAFANIQMKIVLKQYRISAFRAPAISLVVIAALSAATGLFSSHYALAVQCALLSLSINIASLVVRDHLQWGEKSYFLLAMSVGAVLTYGSIIYGAFYAGLKLTDVVTLMILIITIPALCVLVNSRRHLLIDPPVAVQTGQ